MTCFWVNWDTFWGKLGHDWINLGSCLKSMGVIYLRLLKVISGGNMGYALDRFIAVLCPKISDPVNPFVLVFVVK